MGGAPPKKVENLKKKMDEAAPPSVADAEEPVEPGETTIPKRSSQKHARPPSSCSLASSWLHPRRWRWCT
eukprot:5560186-Prymnesium_polylepis.1